MHSGGYTIQVVRKKKRKDKRMRSMHFSLWTPGTRRKISERKGVEFIKYVLVTSVPRSFQRIEPHNYEYSSNMKTNLLSRSIRMQYNSSRTIFFYMHRLPVTTILLRDDDDSNKITDAEVNGGNAGKEGWHGVMAGFTISSRSPPDIFIPVTRYIIRARGRPKECPSL